MTAYYPVAVVGAGPAGLEAAIIAAEAGAEVVLVDGFLRPGGQYFKQTAAGKAVDPVSEPEHHLEAERMFQRLSAAGVRLLTNTMVWGAFPAEAGQGWLLTMHGPDAPSRLQAEVLILATGAFDRPVPFPGWTLPGVVTAGAVQTLLKNQRVLPGRRFLLSGTGPLQLAVAAHLIQAGAEVLEVLEGAQLSLWKGLKHIPALWGQGSRIREGWSYLRSLRTAGVPYRTGWSVVEARGENELETVVIARLDRGWRPVPGTRQTIAADTLVLGYGFLAATQLTRLLNCEQQFDLALGGWLPRRDELMQTTQQGVFAVGDGAGIGGAPLAQIEGRIAGIAAAGQVGKLAEKAVQEGVARQASQLARERRFARLLADFFTPAPDFYKLANKNTIICRCEEVRLGQIREAVGIGARSVNEVKGLTRCGMGNCQGRVCADLLARAIAAELNTGDDYATHLEKAGAFTARPPIHPLPLTILAEAAVDQEDFEAIEKNEGDASLEI
jgi:NADPH-dependent 2,4-dienoyl-CoA reductase/sulfur reductase-like enzyme